MRPKIGGALAVVVFVLAPAPDQCDQPVFARANPGLCYPGPLGSLPGGSGGGGSGGLLGGIGRIVHNLTGGLL
jgi:hypothetical protein